MRKSFTHPIHVLFIMTSVLSLTSLATEYVGEVRIYVDQSAFNTWMQVTGKSTTWDFLHEMNSTIFEVNDIFKTLQNYNVYIKLQIDDVIFINKNILNTNNYGQVNNKQAISQFENWLKPSYSNKQYDLAILYTGVNLVRGTWSDITSGYAYIGTVCSDTALAVVELRGTYSDVLTTAHEIGHILGADHDGTKSAMRCSSNSGEIMNALTKEDSSNHFYFSSCSANSISDVIGKLNNDNSNCLTRWYLYKEIYGPRFASLMTPDEICKRKFGSNSYIARKAYDSYGDNVCTEVACMTKTSGTYFYWTYELTPPGLKCGKSKQCIRGKCITTSEGSDQFSDKCPFGDQPKIEGSYQMTCADMTSSKCANWNTTCCQTCDDPGTADEVCRTLQGSNSAMARRAYKNNSYGDLLCSKLACLSSVTGTYFQWNYFTAPDGMKCGKNKRCKSGKCAMHNLGDPSMSDTCPYGDQPWLGGDWQKTCFDQTRQNGCVDGWSDTCCGSCGDPGTADEICQRLEGRTSVMARRAYTNYGNNLCSKLACLTRVSGTSFYWNQYTAPDGMKCGKSRRCYKGQCLWTVTGDSNMSDWCPYGDQPWLAGNWQTTCSNYVRQNGCSGSGWRDICCSSC